ncbi:acyltransferase [Luteibacter sp. CQ10]|uniref:acyltransferase n=1 Tax=Luteibacter sp. CQ10 TaxID=2805821 RepID=UPI0034A0F25B
MRSAETRERAFGMDVTRAAACAMVVLLHVAATYFYSFGPLWIPALIYDAFTRGCVPIFIMLSGALLLPKEEPISLFFRKRAFRIIPPLVFWTIVYVSLFGERSVSLSDQLGTYLTRPYGHLWYFYVLIGLYLSAPYLGKMFRASNERETRIFLILWFFFACVLEQLRIIYSPQFKPETVFGTQLFSGYLGFFVLGAYLQQYGKIATPKRRWTCVIAFTGASAATACLTYVHSMHVGKPEESFYFSYLTPLVAVAGMSAFAFFSSITSLPNYLATPIAMISDCSLGIYCVHVMIISFFVERLHMADFFHTTWFKIPLLWAAIFLSATSLIYLVRKIPLMRYVA